MLSSSEEEVDNEFERANAWRLENLSWCKCGHCALSTKAIECLCCHEKAVEYDEYGVLLDQTEALGEECLTIHPDFRDNILSEGVLKIDVCSYLEENWPLDDGDGDVFPHLIYISPGLGQFKETFKLVNS